MNTSTLGEQADLLWEERAFVIVRHCPKENVKKSLPVVKTSGGEKNELVSQRKQNPESTEVFAGISNLFVEPRECTTAQARGNITVKHFRMH